MNRPDYLDDDWNDLEWDKGDEHPVEGIQFKKPRGMNKLNVTVAKTADGLQDYIQILSEDAVSVNIVFVGDITVKDHRKNGC